MTIDRKYNDSSLSNLWKPFNLKKKKKQRKIHRRSSNIVLKIKCAISS